jgi:5-formyltetrahydrofolate cyclo-ligase
MSSSLRLQVRDLRRTLSRSQREQAALQLAKRVSALPVFAASQHIAAYIAVDGEMDPAPLLSKATAFNKQVYLPVLTADAQCPMVFAPYRAETKLKPNRFKILEPDVSPAQWRNGKHLDLVLAPLVGFDANGNRLGMGGGFYDRTFAFRRATASPWPYLLGLAYELQKVDALEQQPWDIPLDGVATECALYEVVVNQAKL